MSSGKQSKIQMLKMEIAVKDRLIGALVKSITNSKIKLEPHVIKILEAFYVNQKVQQTNGEEKRN